jgi:hypothetical protein
MNTVTIKTSQKGWKLEGKAPEGKHLRYWIPEESGFEPAEDVADLYAAKTRVEFAVQVGDAEKSAVRYFDGEVSVKETERVYALKNRSQKDRYQVIVCGHGFVPENPDEYQIGTRVVLTSPKGDIKTIIGDDRLK